MILVEQKISHFRGQCSFRISFFLQFNKYVKIPFSMTLTELFNVLQSTLEADLFYLNIFIKPAVLLYR